MARLEYRLLDESREFPILYYYDPIDKDEISLRFACDYFIKDHKVYEKTSCAIEPRVFVIYVKPANDEQVVDFNPRPTNSFGAIRIELREYLEEGAHYPIMHTFELWENQDALLHLQSDYLTVNGIEWKKTSTEVDEDRQVYVYYAVSTA